MWTFRKDDGYGGTVMKPMSLLPRVAVRVGGLSLLVLMLTVYILSARYSLVFSWFAVGVAIALDHGILYFNWFSPENEDFLRSLPGYIGGVAIVTDGETYLLPWMSPLVYLDEFMYAMTPPAWPICLAATIGTFFIWRWTGPAKPGCCLNCGYDLTLNASGRCPECGTTCERDARNAPSTAEPKED